jgi:hypothetical protein
VYGRGLSDFLAEQLRYDAKAQKSKQSPLLTPIDIARRALLTLPVPQHRLTHPDIHAIPVEEMQKKYPYLYLATLDGEHYLFLTNTDKMFTLYTKTLEEKTAKYSRELNIAEVGSFLHAQRGKILELGLRNKLDSDSDETTILYVCLPDEEEKEFDGGSCWSQRDRRGRKLLAAFRKKQDYRKRIRQQIHETLSNLPKMGPFPGGEVYRAAEKRFERLQPKSGLWHPEMRR